MVEDLVAVCMVFGMGLRSFLKSGMVSDFVFGTFLFFLFDYFCQFVNVVFCEFLNFLLIFHFIVTFCFNNF